MSKSRSRPGARGVATRGRPVSLRRSFAKPPIRRCRSASAAGWSASLAEREHIGPDGRPTRVARTTLDDWIRAYRSGGYEALVPRPRKVVPRTPARILELAIALKRERPDRTAAQIHAILTAAGEPRALGARRCRRTCRAPGSTTGPMGARRARSMAASKRPPRTSCGPAMGCTARSSRRPAVARCCWRSSMTTSRLLVGWRWVTGEDVFGLEAALRPALMARGVPEAVLVDRGSAFVSSQLLRACAVLGAKLIHASPRAATTKGKIERFFRTCRDRFLVELADRDDLELSAAQPALRRVAGGRLSPARAFGDRADAAGAVRCGRRRRRCCRRRSCCSEAFLWSENRMVTKTATVSLFGNDYEVDAGARGPPLRSAV